MSHHSSSSKHPRPKERCVTIDPSAHSFLARSRGNLSSIQSNCNARCNTVSFLPGEQHEDWQGMENSSNSRGDVRPKGVEVMDDAIHQVGHHSNSIQMHGDLTAMFQVRGGANNNRDGNGDESSDPDGDGTARLQGRGGIIDGDGDGGVITEEVPYHWQGDLVKYWRATSKGDQSCHTVGLFNDDSDRSPPFPLWSSTAALPLNNVSSNSVNSFSSGDDSDTSSKLWDRVEESRKSEWERISHRDLMSKNKEQKERKRKLYVRRCAKAMLTFVALAALSISVIYLVEEDFDSIIDMMPSIDFFNRLLNEHGDGVDEHELEKDQSDLRYRKLPIDRDVQNQTMTSTPISQEDQISTYYDGDIISPQERNRRARAERIRAREKRLARREQQTLAQGNHNEVAEPLYLDKLSSSG
eukprot:CAMPEP_0196197722 /NCGR_PEP_ID=MMETSP0912-20130531/2077_1 /TAXON_ID=49265 /ORGANISM="Thalassiosira rotula, Strain GSO102" /LENGTH=411 /DNA_ID=CAMNT_0041470645 /DNA_START=80 /DNA_END=1315 /DNA_ORIENTATION=-